MIAIAALVAAALAFAFGSSGGNDSVTISPVDGGSLSEVVEQTNGLIDDNTR